MKSTTTLFSGKIEMGVVRSVLVVAVALGAAALALCGCKTVESDLPWNTPQSWEGSPFIPGLSGQ